MSKRESRQAKSKSKKSKKEPNRTYVKINEELKRVSPLIDPGFTKLTDDLTELFHCYDEMKKDILTLTSLPTRDSALAKEIKGRLMPGKGERIYQSFYSDMQSSMNDYVTLKTVFFDQYLEAAEVICDYSAEKLSGDMLKKLRRNEHMKNALNIDDRQDNWLLNDNQLTYFTSSGFLEPFEAEDKVKIRTGSNFNTYKGVCAGVTVSIKVLKDVSKARKDNLKNNIETLNNIRDDHVALFMGAVLNESNTIKIVTEYGAKGSLKDILASMAKGKLKISNLKKLGLIKDLVSGVCVLHDRGIIHCDVSPGNISVDEQFRLKLGGFDKAIFGTESEKSKIVGTPDYIAPEVYTEKNYSPKIDAFAVGVTSCEILTGKVPYPLGAESLVSEKARVKFYMEKLQAGESIAIVPDHSLTRAISEIIAPCLEHDPNNRISVQYIRDEVISSLIEEQLGGGVEEQVIQFWKRFNDSKFKISDEFIDEYGNVISVPWATFLAEFKEEYLQHHPTYYDSTELEGPEKDSFLCLKHTLKIADKIIGEDRVNFQDWKTFNVFFTGVGLINSEIVETLNFIVELYRRKWWFGFIDSKTAEALLGSEENKGACYLVRGSQTAPNMYTISWKTGAGEIRHNRQAGTDLKHISTLINDFIANSKHTMKCSMKAKSIAAGTPYLYIWGEFSYHNMGYEEQ